MGFHHSLSFSVSDVFNFYLLFPSSLLKQFVDEMFFQRNICFKIVLLNLAVNLFLAIFPGSLLIQVCQRTTFYLYLPIPIHHHHHLRIMLMLSISMDGKITFPRLGL
jgi:hypothetical protein